MTSAKPSVGSGIAAQDLGIRGVLFRIDRPAALRRGITENIAEAFNGGVFQGPDEVTTGSLRRLDDSGNDDDIHPGGHLMELARLRKKA